MTDDTRQDDRRLSKFSNADRLAYSRSNAPAPNASEPLAEMLETAIRGERWGHHASDPVPELEQPEPPEILPEKLVLELHQVQDRLWTEPQPPASSQDRFSNDDGLAFEPDYIDEPPAAFQAYERTEDEPSRTPSTFLALLPARPSKLQRASDILNTASTRVRKTSAQVWLAVQPAAKTAAYGLRRGALTSVAFAVRVGPGFHPVNIRRRYHSLVWAFHAQTLDRGVERLLFKKSDSALVGGPQAVPRLGLDWAWSALPSDLKRFAFVDFRAGKGRNLLLASKLNFEFASGFVYDQQSYDDLKLNVAQYPRSRMACRDIRIVRGDEEGIAIPQQPIVLFFASSIPEGHLDIIMSHVSASFRLNPRPMFLVFENAAPHYAVPYTDIFRLAQLPAGARIKMALFNPARTLVYQSGPISGESGSDERE